MGGTAARRIRARLIKHNYQGVAGPYDVMDRDVDLGIPRRQPDLDVGDVRLGKAAPGLRRTGLPRVTTWPGGEMGVAWHGGEGKRGGVNNPATPDESNLNWSTNARVTRSYV
ncbi:hypothetical protein DBV15_07593 [Temnothorax longispinosus]|uniref:Uncharacterized protein n=1 Tax=Temnothorax longispinosus TaxID=300112 RepID=A0A4S2L5B0_9HYME|nr:hypothetical protein DBV15_07593 [Temnothorax longispinosus]